MRIREWIGIVSFVIGMIIVPFGYWTDQIYFLLGLFLILLGAGILFAKRTIEKFSESSFEEDPLDPPILTKELRGFPGSKIKKHDPIDYGDDFDGD